MGVHKFANERNGLRRPLRLVFMVLSLMLTGCANLREPSVEEKRAMMEADRREAHQQARTILIAAGMPSEQVPQFLAGKEPRKLSPYSLSLYTRAALLCRRDGISVSSQSELFQICMRNYTQAIREYSFAVESASIRGTPPSLPSSIPQPPNAKQPMPTSPVSCQNFGGIVRCR
jgi:hypothetical protein